MILLEVFFFFFSLLPFFFFFFFFFFSFFFFFFSFSSIIKGKMQPPERPVGTTGVSKCLFYPSLEITAVVSGRARLGAGRGAPAGVP